MPGSFRFPFVKTRKRSFARRAVLTMRLGQLMRTWWLGWCAGSWLKKGRHPLNNAAAAAAAAALFVLERAASGDMVVACCAFGAAAFRGRCAPARSFCIFFKPSLAADFFSGVLGVVRPCLSRLLVSLGIRQRTLGQGTAGGVVDAFFVDPVASLGADSNMRTMFEMYSDERSGFFFVVCVSCWCACNCCVVNVGRFN